MMIECERFQKRIIANKDYIKPKLAKPEPVWNGNFWDRGTSDTGYEFSQFLGNVYAHMHESEIVDGVQQLIHHYYLQNGNISAKQTADRIKATKWLEQAAQERK